MTDKRTLDEFLDDPFEDSGKVVKLPEVNARLGSCPECGKPIWEDDEIVDPKFDQKYTFYCCIECGMIMKRDEIIPF